MSGRNVIFVYADAEIHSGQRRATEFLIRDLSDIGWECQRIGTPVLIRKQLLFLGLLIFGWQLASVWIVGIYKILCRKCILHVNLGQSVAAFVRDGLFILVQHHIKRGRVVVSLHGSWFLEWPMGDIRMRLMGYLLRRSSLVTVLGVDQAERLTTWGVRLKRIEIVDNTCDLPVIEENQLVVKHRTSEPIKVLFMALLVDTKGYPEFLEGLLIYSKFRGARHVEAKLCGETIDSSHAQRFADSVSAVHYISDVITRIEETGIVRVEWVRSVEGKDKVALFREAQVFVLPSRLDAQPLVLIEAMASGCAIIASTVGQIKQTVGPEAAILRDDPTADDVARILHLLSDDSELRLRMALAGRTRFLDRFSRVQHATRWRTLMAELVKD